MENNKQTNQLTPKEMLKKIMLLIEYNRIPYTKDPIGIVRMGNIEITLLEGTDGEMVIQVNYKRLPDPKSSNDTATCIIESVDYFKELYKAITQENLKDVPEAFEVFWDIIHLIESRKIPYTKDPIGIVRMGNIEITLLEGTDREMVIQVNYKRLPDPGSSNDTATCIIKSVDEFIELYETITQTNLGVKLEAQQDIIDKLERVGEYRR